MKPSLLILISLMVLTQARERPVTSLAQSSSSAVNRDHYWAAGKRDTRLPDSFDNEFIYYENGDFQYTDESGVTWTHDHASSYWYGSNYFDDHWDYYDDGTMNYYNSYGDWWHHYPDDVETFVNGITGSLTITYPGYEQLKYACLYIGC